jgi:dTDP-4-dehydrorhamnose 3,5-epimerase
MIDGVVVKKLNRICDERGYLMEILRSDDEFFQKFGQAYLTCCYPGVVKAWHYHKRQTDHFCCVQGEAKVVLYDSRDGSPTRGEVNEFFMGVKNPILLRIPNLVFHGFKAIGGESAVIVNIPTECYDYQQPDEFRLPYDSAEIPYNWEIKFG